MNHLDHKAKNNHHNSIDQAQVLQSRSDEEYEKDSQEDSFGEYLKKEKHRKRKQKIRYFKKTKSNGFWRVEENILYLGFLENNKQAFADEKTKRQNRIFRKMSVEIKTRSSPQCRSHHQKFEAAYRNLDELIKGLRRKLTINQSNHNSKQQEIGGEADKVNYKRASFKQIGSKDKNCPRSIPFSHNNGSTVDEETKPQGYRIRIDMISSLIEKY